MPWRSNNLSSLEGRKLKGGRNHFYQMARHSPSAIPKDISPSPNLSPQGRGDIWLAPCYLPRFYLPGLRFLPRKAFFFDSFGVGSGNADGKARLFHEIDNFKFRAESVWRVSNF